MPSESTPANPEAMSLVYVHSRRSISCVDWVSILDDHLWHYFRDLLCELDVQPILQNRRYSERESGQFRHWSCEKNVG